MAPEQKLKTGKWYWPATSDLPSAIAASNNGVWAAGTVSALTTVISAASLVLSEDVAGIGAWGFIDALVFGGIAFGIYRRSRFCAVAGLALFLIEKILQLAAFGLGILGLGVAGFFVVLFLIGIKGTFAFHSLKSKSLDENENEKIAEKIKEGLRGKIFSDSAPSLRDDRNR